MIFIEAAFRLRICRVGLLEFDSRWWQ